MGANPPIAVPDPQLQHVDNQTPFPHMEFDKMGPGRRFHDVVVVRGCFELESGTLQPSGLQPAPISTDEWWDETNAQYSSIKEVGDVLLYKPTTDVFVTGTAHAPRGAYLRQWQAGIQISNHSEVLARHILNLTGPRCWQYRRFKNWHLSEPEPTRSVPLRYELAYGGSREQKSSKRNTLERVSYPPNPSGTGFFDEQSLDRNMQLPGPQIETVQEPIVDINRNYPLAGFGPVARFWSCRAQYAGTYDAQWQHQFDESLAAGLAPDFPDDFDLRFYQYAPPELICPKHLQGDEQIALGYLLADNPSHVIALPNIKFSAHPLIFRSEERLPDSLPFILDTVHIDLDSRKVNLTWRLTLQPEMGVRVIAITQESQR